MTRAEALPLARRIAAAVCELDGCGEDFCTFMREGSFDDHREVQAAISGLVINVQRATRKPENVAELAA